MKEPAKSKSRRLVPLKLVQMAVAEPTRWKILDVLQQQGPLTTEYVTQAVDAVYSNVSKHLIFLMNAKILDRKMGRLYAIAEEFLVPGERALDFGAIRVQFDAPEAKA